MSVRECIQPVMPNGISSGFENPTGSNGGGKGPDRSMAKPPGCSERGVQSQESLSDAKTTIGLPRHDN